MPKGSHLVRFKVSQQTQTTASNSTALSLSPSIMETWEQCPPNSGYDRQFLRWLEKKEEGDRTNMDCLGHFTVSRGSKGFVG